MRRPILLPTPHSWTLSDGYELRGRIWPPTRAEADTGVLYIHGIQSHGGWFEGSAAWLAQSSGAPVLLPDRRGSGLNSAARGDTPSAERWFDDLDELADWGRRAWHVTRFDVVGISWGGKLAVGWALRRPDSIRRLLLVAPGFFPAVDVGIRTRLRIGWAVLKSPQQAFTIPLNDPALFTDNPAGREFIRSDPHKLTQATARFFYESTLVDRQMRRVAAGALRTETTLLLAGRDRIIHNERTRTWLQHVAAWPPAIRTLSHAAHTLEFESQPQAFDENLAEWAAEYVR